MPSMTQQIPSSIPLRRLGKGGPMIPVIGFGAMGLSAFYGEVPKSDEERFAVFDAALASGAFHIDTSDFYADSQELIGRWLKSDPSLRSKVFLATKFGATKNGDDWRGRGDPEYVEQAIKKNLSDLQTDYIDLLYIHRIDPTVPIEDTMNAILPFVHSGQVRHIGLSEMSADTLRRAHAVHPIACVQVEYSPFALEIEQNGVLKTARELGVAIMAYSPLGRGFLTGRYKSVEDFEEGDFRRRIPRFQGENFKKNLELVDVLKKIGEGKTVGGKKGATPAQVCLAWVLRQGDDFLTIPGTKRIEIVKENAGTVEVQLTDEEEGMIRKAIEACGTFERVDDGMGQYADSAPKRE